MPLGGGGLTGSPGAVTHKLEADFSGTSFGGSPTWTDITAYWMSAGSDPGGSPAAEPWGRQDQGSTVESSTTSFVLNNSDGRFTPGKALLITGSANPYYPNVKRRVRMRHTIFDGTTTLTMEDGYVDSWTVTVQTNGPTLSTVSLSDGFARLQASTTLRAMVTEEVLLDAPLAYYPLTEDAGATSFGDAKGLNAAAALVSSKYGAATVTAGVTAKGLLTSGVNFSNATVVNSAQTVASLPASALPAQPYPRVFSLEVWFQTSATTTNDAGLLVLGAPGAFAQVSLTTRGNQVSFHQGPNSSGADVALSAAVTVADGNWHHLVGTYDLTTTRLYLDGAQITSWSTASPGSVSTTAAWIGGSLGSGNVIYGFTGAVAHAAIYSSALSAARVAAHYSAGANAFAGESTATRFARLASYRPSLGVITTGTMGTVGAGDIAGMSLGDALTGTATAEGGVIQTNRGALTLIGRSNWYDPATTLTLDAANGEVDLPTTWRDDTQALVNDVTVSRPNGADQRAVNTASTTGADGVAQSSLTANLNSDRDAADMAGWLVAVGVREQLDSPTLTVNLYARASATLTMAVCALKTYDVVTLVNLPASAPASTMTFQVQGGTYTVGADTFTAELYTTTMPPPVLQVKPVADAYTRLDTGNVIAW